MEIEGLGGKKLDQLVEAGLVTDEASLWDLDLDALVELPRWKERSARKLIDELEQAKERPLQRLLFALGVPGVGERVAKQLAQRFPSLEDLAGATTEELESIDGVGPSLSASLRRWFSDEDNRVLVDRLRSHGIDPHELVADDRGARPLDGTVFVVSGSLSRSRREMRDRLEALGAKVAGSVSSKTTHLLAGPGAGSKLVRARELGVDVVDEDGLEQLLRQSGGEKLWPR
jgi:DNA ligase (NAD+)